ncbi:hypothetical protein GCM10023144_43250 [Pigmentiphaga soli]|uniref:Lipoprotein n=1 Tax=Pigmentiphaga soli TaxID=1007095 RepID=A0ABP8HNP0_9BURK
MSRLRIAFAWVVLLLAACSPKYDWREMPAADGAVRVAFPSRPQSETRDVDVGGHTLSLTFTVAQIDTSVFAVGHARLPPAVRDDPAEMAKVADGFEEVLRANLQGSQTGRRDVALKQAPSDTRRLYRSVELEVHGTVADSPAWLLGRMVVLGDMLIEVIALGNEADLPRDVAQTFVQSLRAE